MLGKRLRQDGHAVRRINLCLADAVYWMGAGHDNYRGDLDGWPVWLRKYLRRHGVTDILYYADRLPYHVKAQDLAREMGIRAHAIEYGYLRPDWLTHEPFGMGPNSLFPRDPDVVRALAAHAPDPDRSIQYPHAFASEASREVVFNLLMVFGRLFYPFYRSDRYYWPIAEYLSSAKELTYKAIFSKAHERAVDRFLNSDTSFNLLALQIQSDYQIRDASPYDHIEEMIEEVMVSLKHHAPADRHLVIKTHPLDCGLEFWESRVRRLGLKHAMTDRVHLVYSSRLIPLIQNSRGVVLANSTVGLHALGERVPVKVMGSAIYDVAGLTHQGPLDSFWTAPDTPDPDFAEDFARALAATIQVKGSFFNPAGLEVAVDGITRRLMDGFGPLEPHLQDRP